MASGAKTKAVCKQLGDGRYLCSLADRDGEVKRFRTKKQAEARAERLNRRDPRYGAVAEHPTGPLDAYQWAVRWRTRTPWHLK